MVLPPLPAATIPPECMWCWHKKGRKLIQVQPQAIGHLLHHQPQCGIQHCRHRPPPLPLSSKRHLPCSRHFWHHKINIWRFGAFLDLARIHPFSSPLVLHSAFPLLFNSHVQLSTKSSTCCLINTSDDHQVGQILICVTFQICPAQFSLQLNIQVLGATLQAAEPCVPVSRFGGAQCAHQWEQPMPWTSPFSLSTSSFLLLLLVTWQWKVNTASLSHHRHMRSEAGFPFSVSMW